MNKFLPRLLQLLGNCSVLILFFALGSIICFLLWRGLPTLNARLFFGDVSPVDAIIGLRPVWDGIWPACVGTLSLVGLTMAFALLPGIGCGIFLAEYASGTKQRWQRQWLGLAVDMLAGVPSIVMGLAGFTMILFLRHSFAPDANTCLALGAACLALLILPSMVVTTREAIQATPVKLRLAGIALGLNQGQLLRHVLLPSASRGILGGVMICIGRAAEDTAVIMLTGVVANAGLPAGLGGKFEALPFHIFYTAAQYQTQDELNRGFGAALVLLGIASALLLCARLIARGYTSRWRGITT